MKAAIRINDSSQLEVAGTIQWHLYNFLCPSPKSFPTMIFLFPITGILIIGVSTKSCTQPNTAHIGHIWRYVGISIQPHHICWVSWTEMNPCAPSGFSVQLPPLYLSGSTAKVTLYSSYYLISALPYNSIWGSSPPSFQFSFVRVLHTPWWRARGILQSDRVWSEWWGWRVN